MCTVGMREGVIHCEHKGWVKWKTHHWDVFIIISMSKILYTNVSIHFMLYEIICFLSCRLELPEADRWIAGSVDHPATSSDQSERAVHLQACQSAAGAWRWRRDGLPQCSARSVAAEAVLERRPPVAEETPTGWSGLPPCVWHLCQIPGQAGPCWRRPLPGQHHLLTWCSRTCKPKFGQTIVVFVFFFKFPSLKI